MTSSPPQEAEHVRHQSLTPESPRPQNVPSPANIPILVEQMDPSFNDLSYDNASSTSASQFPPRSQTPNTSAPYFVGQSGSNGHNVASQNARMGGVANGYPQSAAFGGNAGTQVQDISSIQNFSSHHQSRAASASDASRLSGQELHTAYPFSHDHAYAAQQAQAQSAQGAHYQTEAQAATSVDVQALLDSLTPAANNAPSGHYVVPPMSASSAQSQSQSSVPQLPAAINLPPRPPAQEKPATHPNYNPNDDIRSYHPHSQQPSASQQRGSGQISSLNMQRQDFPGASAQSPTAPSQTRQSGQRSVTPDDEDIRWPPEINRKYEEFLDQERKFVTEGQWDQFPMGSRLFIGNFASKSTKILSDTLQEIFLLKR